MGAYLPLPYVYEREGGKSVHGIYTVDYLETELYLLAPRLTIMWQIQS